MDGEALHNAFKEAFNRVSETSQKFPPDVLLRFYALYKQATKDKRDGSTQNEHQLISAFKSNALFQVQHLNPDEAKLKYIETARQYLKEEFKKNS